MAIRIAIGLLLAILLTPRFARARPLDPVAGSSLPAVQDPAVEAVVPLAGGNVQEGGKLFRRYCAPCHRTAARGGALAFTGINAPSLVGKPAIVVAVAIRSGPGPMPSFPPFVFDDHQVASIVEYVGLVQHPPSPGGVALRWIGPVAEGFIAWMAVFTLLTIAGWIEAGRRG